MSTRAPAEVERPEAEIEALTARLRPHFRRGVGHRHTGEYVRGLLGPSERKNVEPLAARAAPAAYEQVHHFVCASCWDPAPLAHVLADAGYGISAAFR